MISSGRLIRLPSGGRGGSKANGSGFSPMKENKRKNFFRGGNVMLRDWSLITIGGRGGRGGRGGWRILVVLQ